MEGFNSLLNGVQEAEVGRIVHHLNRAYIDSETDFLSMHGGVVGVIVEGALRSSKTPEATRALVCNNLDRMLSPD